MTKLRKFFASSVMVMTVVVMSGLTAPMTTNAAASAGDLIKKDGLSAVYYLGEDGKRYVFPNEATYKSWYSDFSGVVTISADELASYPLGGNVVVRPGTKLVKITTDPKVYAVEANGTLRQIPNEAAAIALYGADWAKRVIDVADSFFTNYTIGSALGTNEVPKGSLVKKTGDSNIYYYDGTNYRLIEDEVAFLANRFQYANVLTLSTFTAGGSTITGAEAGIIKTSQTGSTGTVITGSGLTVALNSMTPASASVPQNGSRVPMAKVNLTAANDGAITVNSITVKRIGLSTYSNIDKVWAEKDGTIVASKKTMNSNDESILTFSPALTINAGQTATLDLIASLTGSNAGNIGLSIVSASAVSASAATVSGSFPINGNLMSPTTYNVTDVTISGAVTATSSVKVGDEKIEMGRFQLAVTKDVVVKSITLKNTGVEELSKASMNLYLEQGGNKVSTSYTVDGRYVTFQLGEFNILKDDASKLFYVKGDVIAKENTASNSFSFILNKSTDLVAYEKATGFGANVVTAPSTAADAYPISNITITAGAISVSKKSTSPSDTTIVKGTDNTILLANVRVDEAVTVEGLNLTYATTSATQFENARVYVNGVLLDSFDPATTTNSRAIDSTFTLNKGDNEVKVMVRAKSNATATSAINFTLTGSSMFTNMNPEYVISGNTVTVTPGGSATSATFTVQGGKLTTTRNDGYAAIKTIVKGSSDVSLGKFIVKAENDEVKITSIALGANIGSSTGTTSADNISDMKLYVDGVQVGNTVDFSSTGATFSSLSIVISKDTTKSIEIKGSFDSSASGVFQVDMTSTAQDSRGTALVHGSGGCVLTARTTSFSVADQGTLNVALGGNTPSAGMLAAKNGVEQEIAQFKFTAINDDANLTEINVINTPLASTTITSTSAAVADADARIAAVKLYDGSTLIDSFVPVSGAGKFTITNDRVKVSANSSRTLTVKVVLNSIENDANATNKDIHLGITTLKFKSSNGTENTQGVALLANNFRVRKSIPTVATVALPTTVLTAGDAVISKFTVTADSNGDVALKKIVLTTTNTSNATITTSTAASTLKVNGSFKTVTSVAYAANTFTVTLANDEIISAGSSKTFEIMAGLTVSGTGSESVTTKIVEDASYGTTGSFEWSDGASIEEGTYSNGHRVNGLTTGTQVLSK